MKRVLVLLLAASLTCLPACSTGHSRPPIGLAAYEGSHVTDRSVDIYVAKFHRDNALDLLAKAHIAHDREPVRVYVEPSGLGTSHWKDSQLFDEAALRDEITNGVMQALTTYGRFERVVSRDRAEVIASSRMSTIAPWGDWFKSQDEVKAVYEDSGGLLSGIGRGEATAEQIQDWSREGVDLVISISLAWAQTGDVFATGQATGQLVSRRGSIFQTAGLSAGGGTGEWSGAHDLRDTAIREEQLPQLVSCATKGAAIVLHKKIDSTLWGNAAEGGVRPKIVRYQ